MKVLRCCVIILVSTLIFASCKPDGMVLDNNVMVGTPSKADTVLPLKYHTKSDTTKRENESLPAVLQR